MHRTVLMILIGLLTTMPPAVLAQDFVTLNPSTQAFAQQIVHMEGVKFKFKSTPNSVTNYIAFVSFIETASTHIAHLREADPSIPDKVVAAWLFCLFPPFKPPVEKPALEERFARAERAFYSHEARERIRNAIGERPVQLAEDIDSKIGRQRLYRWTYEFSQDSVETLVKLVPTLHELPTEEDFAWTSVK